MTHTITFNLPEEQEELDIHLHATNNAITLDAINNTLRAWLKHGFPPNITTPTEVAEYLRYAIIHEYSN
jgi:hypothetical protein